MLPVQDYKKEKKFDLKDTGLVSHLAGTIKLKVVFIALFTLVGLFATQLVFANNLATDGKKLSQVQLEIKRLESENMSIKAEIAKASSLFNLSKMAQDLGFTKPTRVTIVK